MQRMMYATVILGLSLWGCDGGGHEEAPPTPPVAETTPPAPPAPAGDAHGDHGGHGGGDAASAMAEVKPPEGARVMFVSPADGATVTSPLKVEMGVEGATVQPAGEVKDGTGHHHIIIDGEGVPLGTAVPADDTHIHFGKGQTETELTLTPGEHTLTLQFADGIHRSYGPALSTTIKVTVQGE